MVRLLVVALVLSVAFNLFLFLQIIDMGITMTYGDVEEEYQREYRADVLAVVNELVVGQTREQVSILVESLSEQDIGCAVYLSEVRISNMTFVFDEGRVVSVYYY